MQFTKRTRRIAIASLLLVLLTGTLFYFLKNSSSENQRMAVTMDDGEEEKEKKNDGYDYFREADEFQKLRTRDLSSGKVPLDQMWEAVQQTNVQKGIVANSSNVSDVLSWLERGPDRDVVGPSNGNTRANNGVTSGRIDAILVDGGDPTGKTVWVGGDMGGLWKTTDITVSPANWTLVNDLFPNLIVSSIAQNPANPDIMYFSTGEGYVGVGAAVGSERGIGVFKSIDHGLTWNLLPSTSGFTYSTKMICDNAGNIYLGTAGVGLGLVRSTDGGTTWVSINPTGLGTNIGDIELSSTGRLHVTGRSNMWYRFTDIPTTVSSVAGWTAPTTDFSSGTQRAEMGVNGNTLYVLPSVGGQVPTIWKSVDGGVNWTTSGTPPTTVTGGAFANGQATYDLAVAVNPANANECIIGGIDNAKTINGGVTWTRISDWVFTTGQYVHADQHFSLWYDNGNKLLFGCDGGIHFSSNGGTTIRDRNIGLRLKQFYACDIHPTSTNYFLAGAQDNGTHQLNGAGLTSSVEILGGDGGYVAIDQDEPQFQTGTYVFANFRRSSNSGASWSSGPSNNTGQFINPYDYDDANDKVYAGTSSNAYLRWENPQAGFTYTTVPLTTLGGSIASVCVSPFTPNRVFFGTTGGNLVRADNADATPTGTNLSTGSGMPAGAYLNSINLGSTEQDMVATFTNYGITNVWVSNNGGTSWTGIDGNLPNMPVYWAMFHPDDNSRMYIATETGVWETDLINGGSTSWVPSPNFPTVRTTMFKYRSSDRTLLASTYGRGLWTSTVPLPLGFDLGNPAPATAACPAPATMSISLTTTSNGGFANPISFSASGAQAANITFSPNTPVAPGTPVSVVLNNANTLSAGSYTVTITGTASGAPNVVRNLTYTINPGAGPAIGTPPASQTVCAGSPASFTVVATGTYQWQVSTIAVPAFTDIPTATAATYTIASTTAAQNGNQYRCVVSSQCGSTNSTAATLTVNTAPAITTNPQDITLCASSNHTFTVAATGTALTYVWQESINGGGLYSPIVNGGVYGGQGTSSLTLTGITAGMNTYRYRCVVSGTCPSPATSNGAILTVVTSVGITGQPVNSTICDGANTSFTVAGSGSGIIYQWQVNTGTGFVNVPNGAPYSGINSATLSITGATTSMSGYLYRAQLSNATCSTPGVSNAATLTVNSLPSISSSPASVTLCAGSNNTFSVTAAGTNITYQWQISTAAVPAFTDIPTAIASTYTVTGATAAMNGNQYRVVVSGTCAPPVTSSPATLTVINPVTIAPAGQPANAEQCAGGNVSFTVTGSSTQPINYQWESSTDGGTTWNNIPGANAATYSLNNVLVMMTGNRYRAKLSNATCTTPTVSNAAILTVRALPIAALVSTQPTSLLPGQTATLTATTTGTGGVLTTTWTRNTLPITVTGNTYVANVESLGTYQVTVRETWPSTLFCTSLSQIVTIDATVSSKLFIYPSPNDGRFTVSYYNNGGTSTQRTIIIFDSKGAKVFTGQFPVAGPYTLIPIDLTRISRGIHYVVVGDATGKKLAEGKVHVR